MKRLFLLLAMVGLFFTACEPANGLDEDNNGDQTEQPGDGNTDNPDEPDEPEKPDDKTQSIKFQDENTKLICILHWDEDEDGEFSYEEAAAVTNLGIAFKDSRILSFTELKYFTSLTIIAEDGFEDCASLVKISLPEQITTIKENAFSGCKNLEKIVIPDRVTSIGKYAFNDCRGLTSVTIGNSVTKIGWSAFQDCRRLTSVTIGNSVTSIGNYAFYDCFSLASITIPDSVTSIGESAFNGCKKLTSVTIPNSVTSIGATAFNDCGTLQDVYCKATTPPTGGQYMFDSNPELQNIYVPAESVEKYKSATGWDRYKIHIVGYDF